MMVFDELALLESHFMEEQRKGRKMADLYESVQHAGSVIPPSLLACDCGCCIRKNERSTGEADSFRLARYGEGRVAAD